MDLVSLHEDSVPSCLPASETDLDEQESRPRRWRFKWTPQLKQVLRSLLLTYPDVKAFRGRDRLGIFKRAIERYNEQQEDELERIGLQSLEGLDEGRFNTQYRKVAAEAAVAGSAGSHAAAAVLQPQSSAPAANTAGSSLFLTGLADPAQLLSGLELPAAVAELLHPPSNGSAPPHTAFGEQPGAASAAATQPGATAAGAAQPRAASAAAAQPGSTTVAMQSSQPSLHGLIKQVAAAAAQQAVHLLKPGGTAAGPPKQRRRKKVKLATAAAPWDEEAEDMAPIEEEARAMDLEASEAAAGAGGTAVGASLRSAGTGSSRSEAQREAQRGYRARSATKASFLALPKKISKKAGCELVNTAAAWFDPKNGTLHLETSGPLFGPNETYNDIADALEGAVKVALRRHAKGQLTVPSDSPEAEGNASKQGHGGGVVFFYAKDPAVRPEVKAELEREGVPANAQAIMQRASAWWLRLPEEEKEEWKRKHAARHAAASAQPPGVAGQPQRQQSPPPLPQQQQLDLGSMDLLGSSAEAGGGGEHGGSLLPPQQQGSSVRACPSAAQPGGAATSTQLPELSSMAAARAPATAREAALFSALVPNDSAGGNRESGTHPPRPSAPSLDPALAWLPPHLAPLEGELAFLKDATGSLDYAARAQLAQALRVDPGPLSRIAQARVWQRGQLLLLDGQLVQPWGASVTPRQLKDWFRELAAGVNLGNTQNKEALANKAAAHLVAEVYALPVSVEAARQRITSLLAGAAAARAASVQPMQAAAPHSVVQLGAVSQMGALPHLGGTLQLGGRPHSMMPALPLGLAPGMPQGMPLAANVWQQLAASAGFPYVSDVAAAAAAGYQPLSSFYFQGS